MTVPAPPDRGWTLGRPAEPGIYLRRAPGGGLEVLDLAPHECGGYSTFARWESPIGGRTRAQTGWRRWEDGEAWLGPLPNPQRSHAVMRMEADRAAAAEREREERRRASAARIDGNRAIGLSTGELSAVADAAASEAVEPASERH